MILRPYQQAAVDAVYQHLRTRADNPCVVIPTAGGKTPVMATICRDVATRWNGRAIILAHVRELLEQAADKLMAIAPDVPIGIYSAGMGRRDLGYAVTIAGIQSVYQRAAEVGAVNLAIVDECHLIPEDGEGMYRTFLNDMRIINPKMRVIGLTATPFRMKSGTICTGDNILNHICYEVGVRELIDAGYICPLRTKAGARRMDYSTVKVRGGEFVADDLERLMDADEVVNAACAEVVQHTKDRKSVLIFASGVKHGNHIVDVLRTRHNVECGFVCGDTLPFERDEILARFKRGELKYLCNVNVLTTGFDAPCIDCVVMLRPTMSPGLYYQMVGRGFRIHPGKLDCLVLDFGGNVLRHGPVDAIRVDRPAGSEEGEAVQKECPQCHAIIAGGYAECPECGYEFPPREEGPKHQARAGSAPILTGQIVRETHAVEEVCYVPHTKRNAPEDAPRTMRVDYRVGFNEYFSEWVCFEHTGYARRKAEAWWAARSNGPAPKTVYEAVARAERGELADTLEITIEDKGGDDFTRIVGHKLGEKPAYVESPLRIKLPPSEQAEAETVAGESVESIEYIEADAPCPQCGKHGRTVKAKTAGHPAQESCTWCGRFMRHVPWSEYEASLAEDIPF